VLEKQQGMGASGMTEEPKQGASTSEVTEQKDTGGEQVKTFFRDNDTGGEQVRTFFRDNPALILSLLYLYATAIGIVYSLGLYRSFGINIFDYSEVTDFLLAAFKNAGVLIILVIQVVAVLALLALGLLFKETRAFQFWRYPGRRPLAILLYVVIVVGVTYNTSSDTASSIKDGETLAVDVRYRSFSGSAGQVKESNLRLIGATQKAVFFYDVDAKPKRTIVIPQSQLVSIEVPEQD
jgi:hypothetical protein